MRWNLKRRRLVTAQSNGRTRQFALPRVRHVIILLVLLFFGFLWWHPVVSRLLVHGFRHAQPRSLAEAASVAYRELATDVENTLAAERPARESPLTTYRLTLPNNTLLDMQRSLKLGQRELNHAEGGTKPYFDATLVVDDQPPQEAKISLRGTMFWHHLPAKPSLRIKIKRSDVFGGDRYVELTTLEDAIGVINWLPMQWANWLGLMTDGSEHVRVFLNEKSFGVYVRTMRQGEVYALANERMPGTFFKGDFVPDMWNSVAQWKTFGEQHPDDLRVFSHWLENLQAPVSVATLERNSELFDTEIFARWAALMTVVGSVHTDDRHNHSYFFCGNQGKLHAVPWDPNGCGAHLKADGPVDIQIQPVLRMLSHDPRWIHRRNEWVHQLLNGPASLTAIPHQMNAHLDRVGRDLRADRNLGYLTKSAVAGWHRLPVSVLELDRQQAQIIHWFEARHRYLSNYLRRAQVAVRDVDGRGSEVIVYGSAAVTVSDSQNDFSGFVGTLYPGLSQQSFTSDQPDAPVPITFLKPAGLTYRIPIPAARLAIVNAVTGEPVSPQPWTGEIDRLAQALVRTIHPDRFPRQPTGEITIGPGCVVLREDLHVGPEQSLTIRPGTQVRIAPGVGLYSRGKTTAVGTADKPIRICPAGRAPWAAIGIVGSHTASSRFEHVHVQGGSIGQLGELRFKGMFNVYNCPDVVMRNCRFGENHLGDDNVNLAESKILVERCHWTNANADGMDLDMCRGDLKQCRWFNCGNDGLDLMASQVTVEDCHFEACGDKGISVGENSRCVATNTKILDCQIGIEIKDDSIAQFERSSIVNCQIGARAYQKKWFYSAGGTVALVHVEFADNARDIEAENKSRFLLIDSSMDQADFPSKRVVRLNELPEQWSVIPRGADLMSVELDAAEAEELVPRSVLPP